MEGKRDFNSLPEIAISNTDLSLKYTNIGVPIMAQWKQI